MVTAVVDCRELEEAKHRLETLCETLTVDKELAEASKEELESSVETMRQAQTRMEKEVEALRESEKNSKEAVISSLPADQADGARLVAQNKELTAALIKVRDASNEQSKIQEETILELGASLKDASEEAARASGLAKQLHEAKEQIEELKRQVDEASGFSAMVESLTEKNLTLGEENKKYQSQIEHMQTLIAAEEVEDGHTEYEAQMQSEIETKEGELQESARIIASKDKQIGELNQTVRNFRQLVRKMEGEQQVRMIHLICSPPPLSAVQPLTVRGLCVVGLGSRRTSCFDGRTKTDRIDACIAFGSLQRRCWCRCR